MDGALFYLRKLNNNNALKTECMTVERDQIKHCHAS